MRCLITGDPVRNIQPRFDTSIRLAAELIRRGWRVDYCDLSRCDPSQSSQKYLAQLPVQEILTVDPSAKDFLKLGEVTTRAVEQYALILQRKDPPVDDAYKAHARIFTQAPRHILQINNPDQTWRYSEHALPADYPQYSIPTQVCKSFDEFRKAVRSQKSEAVVKPFDECSGIGIEFYPNDLPDDQLKVYWEQRKPAVIVQPFIEEISKSGDLRILVMNGKVMGQVLRVPRPGSRLANLHQGATGQAYTPSKFQLEACEVIGNDLAQKGLYLLGLDFIGERISEINITCPSAMAQINEVMFKKTEIELVNEIESLRYRLQ